MAALLAAPAGQAGAQEMGTPRASRFDLGVYAGGSATSRWYESRTIVLNGTDTPTENDDRQAFKPGYAPAFGAHATFWATPMFGLRLHGAYVPMRVPSLSDGFFDIFNEAGNRQAYALNSYFYDVNLAARPFIRSGNWYRSVYLFAGGGGLTVDLAGEDRPGCEPGTLLQAACLSYEPDNATVGQGTAGAGIDLLRFSEMLGIFGEIAAHVYDSPVHVGDGFIGPITRPTGSTVRIADDRTAVTTRVVIGLKAMFGNQLEAPMMVPPPTVPPVAPMPEPPVVQPMPPMTEEPPIQVCVVQDGNLTNVSVQYNPTTGDTTVNGQPFATAHPTGAQYAANAPWYIENQPLVFQRRRLVKYGLPRVLGVTEVTRVGEYMGVPLFAEPGQTRPDVVYVPVRPGCEFQPYQSDVKTGSVRGE
jgi:hypothetical protein